MLRSYTARDLQRNRVLPEHGSDPPNSGTYLRTRCSKHTAIPDMVTMAGMHACMHARMQGTRPWIDDLGMIRAIDPCSYTVWQNSSCRPPRTRVDMRVRCE